MLIVLLHSMPAVMRMPGAGRQITCGTVTLVMLLLYGRGRASQT